MDPPFSTCLSPLLEDSKRRGFVYYRDLGGRFPASGLTKPELDHLLSELDRSGIEIVPDPNLVLSEEGADRISGPVREPAGRRSSLAGLSSGGGHGAAAIPAAGNSTG
jgi:hypothetical protein